MLSHAEGSEDIYFGLEHGIRKLQRRSIKDFIKIMVHQHINLSEITDLCVCGLQLSSYKSNFH